MPKTTSWKYIQEADAIDIKSFIQQLVGIFEANVEIINQLKRELFLDTRLQFVIQIDINPALSTPYFGLDKRTISFLGRTNTVVDFDIYKRDSQGIITT